MRFMAEAYALREGYIFSRFLGCNKIVIQSDSSQVIDTTEEGGYSATSSSVIFDDCKVLVIGFSDITFSIVIRRSIRWLVS
jgi:hypothetical protein